MKLLRKLLKNSINEISIEKKILLNLEGKIVKYLIVKYNMKKNRDIYYINHILSTK